jgi:DNA-binding transcriptional ArsR family regulator
MQSSGPLHPRRDDGAALDATFEISAVPVYELVFHHKQGGRASPRSMNADYHEALELIIHRLAQLGATIVGIQLDSSVARALPQPEVELPLDYPIELTPSTNAYELRLEITRAQKPLARRAGATLGGGNDQKRIRITLALQSAAIEPHDLIPRLTGDADTEMQPSMDYGTYEPPPRAASPPSIAPLLDWEWLARTAMHPLQLRILESRVRDPARRFSPGELASEWGEPLGNVSYHVRKLRDHGLLEEAGTEPVRGTVQHYYRIANGGRRT